MLFWRVSFLLLLNFLKINTRSNRFFVSPTQPLKPVLECYPSSTKKAIFLQKKAFCSKWGKESSKWGREIDFCSESLCALFFSVQNEEEKVQFVLTLGEQNRPILSHSLTQTVLCFPRPFFRTILNLWWNTYWSALHCGESRSPDDAEVYTYRCKLYHNETWKK